jgi:hypothetical protein
MTTREKIHKLVDELPESQLDPVAEILASRGKGELISTSEEDAWALANAREAIREESW